MQEVIDDYLECSALSHGFSEYQLEKLKVNYQKYLPDDKNANLLDIGIGNGETLHWFMANGYENYNGIDISKSTINYCKARGLNCELVSDSIEYLNSHPNQFDLITLFHVIEHIPQDKIIDFCNAIYTSLADGGQLIMETPNMASSAGSALRHADLTHYFGYEERTIFSLLKVCGFKKIIIANCEDCVGKTPLHYLRKVLRAILHLILICIRRIESGITHKYLNACIYGVGTKIISPVSTQK